MPFATAIKLRKWTDSSVLRGLDIFCRDFISQGKSWHQDFQTHSPVINPSCAFPNKNHLLKKSRTYKIK
jgi:hypothetical protein